jgi:hypothetical protein
MFTVSKIEIDSHKPFSWKARDAGLQTRRYHDSESLDSRRLRTGGEHTRVTGEGAIRDCILILCELVHEELKQGHHLRVRVRLGKK